MRALSQVSRGHASALRRSSAGHRQHAGTLFRWNYPEDLATSFSYPVPDGETMVSFLREHTREGMQSRYAADAELKSAPPANRARVELDEHLKLPAIF